MKFVIHSRRQSIFLMLLLLALVTGCVYHGKTPGATPDGATPNAAAAPPSQALDNLAVPIHGMTPAPTPALAPNPTPTLAPNPTPSPEPTPVPTPYRSEAYPLTAKSLRAKGESRYPDEKRLNGDPKKFYTVVDLVNQAVFVYERDAGDQYTLLVREMICSSGIEATNRTPRGTFKMQTDYKRFAYFVHHDCFAQYWAQIRNRIYFHSVPYFERDDRSLMEEEFWLLGQPASHGCIRLLPDDAQWVYLYLCPGSVVKITDELPYDEALRARLLPTQTPTPDCYEYAD